MKLSISLVKRSFTPIAASHCAATVNASTIDRGYTLPLLREDRGLQFYRWCSICQVSGAYLRVPSSKRFRDRDHTGKYDFP